MTTTKPRTTETKSERLQSRIYAYEKKMLEKLMKHHNRSEGQMIGILISEAHEDMTKRKGKV